MLLRIVSTGGFCIIIGLLSGSYAKGKTKQRTISIKEGRDLVYALLRPSGCTTRTCGVERLPDKYFPQFFFFEGLWSNPSGSPHIGAWAVDPKTADLWDANVCVEYRPIGVASLQGKLRKRIGLTEIDYKKLKQRPPMCDPGEKIEVRTGKY